MKRILIGQVVLLFFISSVLYAADLPTYSIERAPGRPEIKGGVTEIKPTQERKIRNDVIKIKPIFKRIDDSNSGKFIKLLPQNPDELFRCDDINSLNIHSGPVCAHRIEVVECLIAPCPFHESWISYPNPQEACADYIKEYALGSCVYGEFDPDIEAFKAQARRALCSDLINRLFLIDNKLVFWQVEGNCPDAGYGLTLYDKKTHQILCSEHETIAGPRITINDENYRQLFYTINQNLENPNLGLSSDHRVEEILLTD
ncbi:MAG: hypothetical protein HY761_10635 [Candidatus Omnitrophica bacterium]|nr:hypothetical protein [Candidatus Omnitrophota bacterium]